MFPKWLKTYFVTVVRFVMLIYLVKHAKMNKQETQITLIRVNRY